MPMLSPLKDHAKDIWSALYVVICSTYTNSKYPSHHYVQIVNATDIILRTSSNYLKKTHSIPSLIRTMQPT